ncbi:hypothetical protein QJS66_07520 [Kocuria rhizophila]|nr:hypothetical protein QJS66_07520 [Kocuria rhizophila]
MTSFGVADPLPDRGAPPGVPWPLPWWGPLGEPKLAHDHAGHHRLQLRDTILKAAVVPARGHRGHLPTANLRDVSNAARLAWKTLMRSRHHLAIAAAIGTALAVVVQPGVGTGQPQPETYSARRVRGSRSSRA